MDLTVVSCSANADLGTTIAHRLGATARSSGARRFPDGEIGIQLDGDVRGGDTYLVQSLAPPANDNLIELLLAADACRRAGAARLTAVIPYLAYARQDRRTAPREPVSIRVVGDLLRAAGLDRVVLIDPHSPDVEAVLGLPTEIVSGVPGLAEALREELPAETVIVAPDLGAVDIAEDHAAVLGYPVAVVRKTRLAGDEVRAGGVVGDVEGLHPLIVDDMIATGGTLTAATEALLGAGAREGVRIAASHGLLVGSAVEELAALPLERLLLTDSVPPPPRRPECTRITSVAPVLVDAISRLHHETPLAPVEAHR